MPQSEKTIHWKVASHLRLQYPQAIFHTDFAAGLKMTKAQASMNRSLQSDRGWPDLFITNPINGYSGLMMELKKDGETVLLKNGTISQAEHVHEQAVMLSRLTLQGYYGIFTVGFNRACDIIKWYFGGAEYNEEFSNQYLVGIKPREERSESVY